jgi:NAD(P)-dependent dehydrogenase (short-subunit alcohol dehydrogenase family)
VVESRGHLTVVASLYAFFNGALASPYAVSKAGVEALGRALRAELAPHGASVGVAYYGFIDTEMVRQAIDASPLARRFEDEVPGFVSRRLTAEQAAAALVSGIELRSPRVFAPGWVRAFSALRGILNPMLDRRFSRHPRLQAIVREADVGSPRPAE